MAIFLTGYRGSGKTTAGILAAQKLSKKFLDSDAILVTVAGKSIKEIFEQNGEKYFRELEFLLVKQLANLKDEVIALGGGALLRPESRANIKAGKHHVIYLRCDPQELHRRIHADPKTAASRPSLTHLGGGLEEITQLLSEREPIYKECMTHEIDVTNLSAEEAAEEIARKARRRMENG
jgi:shikimate kinase